MSFSKSINGAGLRTILLVPLHQQADETFDVRLHFARGAQAEFLSRPALPIFEDFVVTRIGTLRLFAGGRVIDVNDGRAFSQSQHLAAQISRTYR